MTPLASLVTPTPVGDALLTASSEGLVSLEMLPPGVLATGVLAEGDLNQAHGSTAMLNSAILSTAILNTAAEQLDEYFAGALREFTVPIDWRQLSGFTAEALRTVVEIPYGETAAYGEVAIMAGRPGAARAVGTACARSPWSIIVPVHRVVRADGSIGPYGNHPETKRFLIDLERENRR